MSNYASNTLPIGNSPGRPNLPTHNLPSFDEFLARRVFYLPGFCSLSKTKNTTPGKKKGYPGAPIDQTCRITFLSSLFVVRHYVSWRGRTGTLATFCYFSVDRFLLLFLSSSCVSAAQFPVSLASLKWKMPPGHLK